MSSCWHLSCLRYCRSSLYLEGSWSQQTMAGDPGSAPGNVTSPTLIKSQSSLEYQDCFAFFSMFYLYFIHSSVSFSPFYSWGNCGTNKKSDFSQSLIQWGHTDQLQFWLSTTGITETCCSCILSSSCMDNHNTASFLPDIIHPRQLHGMSMEERTAE